MVLKRQGRLFGVRLSVLLFSVVFSSGRLSAETKVPHEFASGSPAKAEEVNENFAGLAEAIDEHWARYPNRYYPDWRHDPSFYLELPKLGGFWGGRLNSEAHHHSTTNRNFNFINKYEPSSIYSPKRIWFGFSIVPSPDGAASQISKQAGKIEPRAINLYSFSMSHHKDGSYASISFTEDQSLVPDVYPASGIWQNYMSKMQIEELLPKLYALLKLDSDRVAVNCPQLTMHLNSDFSLSVTGNECVETATAASD